MNCTAYGSKFDHHRSRFVRCFLNFYSLSVNKSIKNRFNLESTCSFDLGFVETDYMDVL